VLPLIAAFSFDASGLVSTQFDFTVVEPFILASFASLPAISNDAGDKVNFVIAIGADNLNETLFHLSWFLNA
jgi:hypothetical protein